MVSKEPNHLLTGQTNGKSTLADKMPGTITVRSVLLNRDSPDIESRLKRRRNRTHKVHFKDLEDGSSSSGNSGTGENNNSHQKPATDCDSPHPVRKQNSRSVKPWCDRGGLHTDCSLPGQTSVVGAVRGDMASTIEVVAAFLARAPPHPLTPGPTRRCWMPPQTNSLTLPMTRKPSTSTSTAIQTSPCLRKPHSISSNHNRSHSFGDSVGMDGDDEHDSQDEFFMHNHALLPWSKHLNGPPGNVDKPVVERRSKASRTENKSTVAVIKNSRHSCPPSVSQITEPCQCSSLCQEGTKRSGSVTPSVVRRRKRLNRTTSDPGKEIHYCTTPTQTERPCSSPPLTNTKVCTTQVQTESVCPPVSSKYCTTQCQTETPQHSPVFGDIKSKPSTQCEALDSVLLPNLEQSVTISENNSSSHSTLEPSLTEGDAPCDVPSLPVSTESNVDLPERTSTQSVSNETPVTEKNTVPYCATSTLTNQPTQTPENDSKSSSSPESQAVCVNPIVSQAPPIALCTSASSVNHPIPYYTVVSPSSNTAAIVACSSPSLDAQPSPTLVETTCTKSIISTSPAVCPATASTATPNEVPLDAIAAPNSADIPQQNATISTSATKQTPCTFVTQTAMSCTSISYYTTTHASGPQGLTNNTTKPSYAALIQTVSHCNIPCRALQNTSVASTGITPYSSPVPRLKSCTSPTPLVKTGTSTLPSRCITPTKAVPLYSSTFRAAPPYTPPSQVPYSAQDKRGMRLPPPPPPPPPYTPRKKETDPPGPAIQTPKLRAESNPVKKEEDNKKENGEHLKCTDSPKRCERANSLKHRAQTPPVSGMKVEKQPSSSSPLKACFKSSCLSSAQAQLGMLHKMLCSGATSRPTTPNSQHALPSNQQGCSGTKGCGGRPTAGPLTAAQADTLKQVQEILGGLMSGARCKLDPARVAERLLSPNGPLRDIRSLQTQLQSLEGVLETSQNTIKVLLDVIQDLEKKEAERDGRHSYRTGQDIENCGTCRDCACIIYSVEHDFRLQEGQVVRTWKVGDPPEAMPPQTSTPVHSAPQQQDSPQPVRPPAAAAKKNKKKCFWFL